MNIRTSRLGAVRVRRLTVILAVLSLAVSPLGTHSAWAASLECTGCENKYEFGLAPVLLDEIWLVGAVGRVGLHYVPKGTDLVKLLVAAGLNAENGEFAPTEVFVKRASGKVLSFQLASLLREPQPTPANFLKLEPHDIVYVPAEKPFPSGQFFRTISMIGAIAGIIFLGYALSERLGRK